MKSYWRWYSSRVECEVGMVRWGHYGTPVLVFPTAGGDAEEIERFGLVGALWPLIEAGRVKVYSCDSVAGRHFFSGDHPPGFLARLQNMFDGYVRWELAPAIRDDCGGSTLPIVTAGSSIGAFNAVASVCRHPDAFGMAIGMSGTYDLSQWLNGHMPLDFYYASPLHYLPDLGEGGQLHELRSRFILLATGEGRWEDPGETWRMAHVLGSKGIPNRVDLWGHHSDHDWPTWRQMLPEYLSKL